MRAVPWWYPRLAISSGTFSEKSRCFRRAGRINIEKSTARWFAPSPALEPVKDTDLILRSLPTGRANARPMTGSASVSKEGHNAGLAAILRDARKGALLRMRSEIYSQPLLWSPLTLRSSFSSKWPPLSPPLVAVLRRTW